VAPGRPALEVARELVRVHPDARGVIDAGRLWTQRAIDFTRDKDLVPYHDGECRVGLAPESRRWAMAMMTPGRARRCGRRPGFTSRRRILAEDEQRRGWRCSATRPASPCTRWRPGTSPRPGAALLTSRGPPDRALQRVRRGWAHYADTVRGGRLRRRRSPDRDRRSLEARVRVTRLACALGVHTAHDGRAGRAPVRGDTHCLVRRAVRGPAGHVRPDLAGTPGASGRSSSCASGPGRTGAPALRCSVSTRHCWISALPRSASSARPWSADSGSVGACAD
jgi:hypothetical protein